MKMTLIAIVSASLLSAVIVQSCAKAKGDSSVDIRTMVGPGGRQCILYYKDGEFVNGGECF